MQPWWIKKIILTPNFWTLIVHTITQLLMYTFKHCLVYVAQLCLVPIKLLFHSKMIRSSTCFFPKRFLAEISCYASQESFEFSRMHQDTLAFTLQMVMCPWPPPKELWEIKSQREPLNLVYNCISQEVDTRCKKVATTQLILNYWNENLTEWAEERLHAVGMH